MRDRRILYIIRRVPFPLNTGTRIRQFELLSAYAQLGEVELVCFYTNEDELAGSRTLADCWAKIHPLSFRNRRRGPGGWEFPQRWERLWQTASFRPFLPDHCLSYEMRDLVEELAPSFDLVHVGRLCMMPHVESLLDRRPRRPRFVLDLDDVETILKRRELRTAPPPQWQRRAFEHLDLHRLRRYEKRALASFDRVLVCSETDRRYFGCHPTITVIPNGASLPAEVLPDGSDGRTLLCLAAYGHWPHADGLHFFVESVFPLIRQEIANARLVAVGRDAPPDVLALHDGRSIFVEGTVPSVEPYYRQATIAVVPLRIAAGTRLRILEAFALGRPVVSTTIGCEGLDIVDGEHLLAADDPQEFANACIRLIRDAKLRNRLVRNARWLVERKYTWESIHRRVHDMARELWEDH